jgi:hypothetical protein
MVALNGLRAAARLGRENALLVGLGAVYLVVVLLALPQTLVQDSWLTLVAGREIAETGLPASDGLTVWTHGAAWIDQQWLAQLAFYGLWAAGGTKLALLAHAALLAAAFFAALTAARSLGASPRSVALVGAVCMLLAPWGLQMRAQSFAGLLFVAVLWLLAADSRSPSWRVLLVLPLLALWANLHGTVVLGALLVVLAGVVSAARALRTRTPAAQWLPRNLALVFGAPLCALVSPYGVELVGYYRSLLLNPTLSTALDEWRPSAPGAATALFYVVAFATVWLLARHGARLTRFESLALLVLLVGALTAIRSIVWFALACTVLLPRALDGALAPRMRRARPSLPPALAGAAVLVAAVVAVGVSSRPASWFEREWPAPAAAAIARATSSPDARVFADDRHADWILWTRPELRGRVAYDVRFELLAPDQLERLITYRNRVGEDWRRVADGYSVVTLDPTLERRLLRAVLAEPGARAVFRGERLVVVVRRSPTGAA